MATAIVWVLGIIVGALVTFVVMDYLHDRAWNREHGIDEDDQ